MVGGLASDEATRPLRDYEIRDKKTGKITEVKEDFINTPLFNPYKILYDDSLEKGSKVQAILEQFQQQDAPQIGPFQMQEDIGTNIADLGFGIARATEPFIRGTSRVLGEISGIQGLKDFGGTQKFSPSIGLSGPDLFKPEYESYVPTDEDRARFMLGGIERKDASIMQPSVESVVQPVLENAGTSMNFEPSFDPYNDSITPMLDELSQERQDLESRFAEEDIQRPPDVQVDEITSLLTQIQPDINIDKTEADSLLETENKFDGLSTDELKSEIDAQMIPAFNAQKEDVKKQVKIFEALESQDIDPDEYFNTARNPVSKKLNEPGFFGTDRFLNFIRNVGAGLVESGQIGEGLATGAAKAAEERAARDIAKDEKEYEMEKLLAVEDKKAEIARIERINKPMEANDLVKYVKFEDEISTALKNFDEDERILSDINQILNEDINSPTAFGAQGFISKINEKFRNAIGMGETEWDKLPAAERTDLILKVTQQRSVRSILGESGKTISNLDREIVAQIFGDVNIFTSPAELRKILGTTRSTIIEGMRSTQNQIVSRANAFKQVGYKSPVLDVNESLIDRILDFNFALSEQYKRGDKVSGFEEIDL